MSVGVGKAHSPTDLVCPGLVDLSPCLDDSVLGPETTDTLEEVSLQVWIPEVVLFVADERVLAIHVVDFVETIGVLG